MVSIWQINSETKKQRPESGRVIWYFLLKPTNMCSVAQETIEYGGTVLRIWEGGGDEHLAAEYSTLTVTDWMMRLSSCDLFWPCLALYVLALPQVQTLGRRSTFTRFTSSKYTGLNVQPTYRSYDPPTGNDNTVLQGLSSRGLSAVGQLSKWSAI
jgi:hypothetical protein